jgi:hypothetical protein
MMNAWLRLGDANQAVAAAGRAMSGADGDARLMRQLAVAHLLANQGDQALKVLDAVLAHNPDDLDAQWLVLQTLFSEFVAATEAASHAARRSRFVAAATAYIAAKGRHAALARDWALAVDSTARLPAAQ